jgi:hypothetical protein
MDKMIRHWELPWLLLVWRLWLWLWHRPGVGIALSTVRTCDDPLGVGIVVGGAAALGMVVAPACEAPLGVGIVVGGTAA